MCDIVMMKTLFGLLLLWVSRIPEAKAKEYYELYKTALSSKKVQYLAGAVLERFVQALFFLMGLYYVFVGC